MASVTLHLDTAVVRLANPSLTTEYTPLTDVSTVQAEGEPKLSVSLATKHAANSMEQSFVLLAMIVLSAVQSSAQTLIHNAILSNSTLTMLGTTNVIR